MLAFIEKRFLTPAGQPTLHLTLRDQHANPLEDLFDFNHSPSLNTPVGQAQPPAVDCTPQERFSRKKSVAGNRGPASHTMRGVSN